MKILDVSTCSMIFVLLFFFSPTDVFSAGNLSDVKVAILYESIGDGMQEDLGISKVEFYVDGALVNTTFDLPYQYLWNTEGVAQGDHKIKVIAYDLSGNKTDRNTSQDYRKHSKLTFANLTDRTKLEIYSLNGILLYESETTESSYSFAPDSFASGIYILVTRNSKGAKSRKIAIIK